MSDPHIITDPADALTYIRSGNATFTLKSLKSGTHYTYAVKAPWKGGSFDYDAKIRFAKLRTGSDEWQYLGMAFTDQPWLSAGKKGQSNHPAYKALDWAIKQFNIRANNDAGMPEQMELWHEGRCGRCGRQLTHPDSIANGIGPECATKV